MSASPIMQADAYAMSLNQRHLHAQLRQSPARLCAPCVRLDVRVANGVDRHALKSVFDDAAKGFDILRARLQSTAVLREPVIVDGGTPRVRWVDEGQVDERHASGVGEDGDDGALLVGTLAGRAAADAGGTRLTLTADPVFADLRTLMLFVDRMSAALRHRSGPREELPFRIAASWQTEILQSPEARPGFEFWEGQRSRSGVPLRLPWIGASRGTATTAQASSFSIVVDTALAGAIERRATMRGVTPEIVLLAAWVTLLARMSEATIVPLYWLRDERGIEDFVRTGGPLTKALPLAIDASPADFERALEQCRLLDEEAGEWAICHDPGAPWNGARPDFAYSFASAIDTTDASAASDPSDAGAGVSAAETLAIEAGSFQLEPVVAQLSVLAAGGTLRLQLDADRSRLPEAFAALWLPRLIAILEAHCGDTPAASAIWPATELARVETWRESPRRSTASTRAFVSIDERIQRHGEAAPRNLAVIARTGTLTYEALSQLADRLAGAIPAFAPGSARLAGILLAEPHLIVAAMLGAWRAGAAFVMFDPRWPSARLQQVVRETGIAAVITSSDLAAPLRHESVALVMAGEIAEPAGAFARCGPHHPNELAYVLMTSGSTGTPKAVAVTHANLASYVDAIVERTGVAECRAFLACTTLAADLAYSALFPALAHGRAVVLADDDLARDADGLAAFARQHEVDACKVVPTHLLALISGAAGTAWLPPTLILGGEAAPGHLIERLRTERPDITLWNHYGPAETTIGSICGRIAAADDHTPPLGASLGTPLPGCTIDILDRHGAQSPIGIPGEIHIGGDQVGAGYWRQPGATAQRFVPDASGRRPGGRLYRTGDLGRWRPDGTIEFLGRDDRQVKIRGHRVELNEIEQALGTHPCVETAAVFAIDGPDGHLQLSAYVLPHPTRARVLREALSLDAASLATLPNGWPVAQVNAGETRHLFEEIFEHRLYLRHGLTIQDGDLVVDAGANIGIFGLFAHAEATGVQVHSFEPLSVPAAALAANARMYGPGWVVHRTALANTSGAEPFTYYPHLTLLSGRYADVERDRAVAVRFETARGSVASAPSGAAGIADMIRSRVVPQEETCQVTTLSDAIRQYDWPRIDLLKIDVQGSEADLLAGIDDALWPRVAQVSMECAEAEADRFAALLDARGFRTIVEAPPHGVSATAHIYAIHPRRRTGATTRPPVTNWLAANDASDDLRAFLGHMLPEALVPTQFRLLPAFPYTANGKLDRAALVASAPELPAAAYAAPIGDTERLLCQIWAELLRREPIGTQDNFFSLGGDSILAIQLVSRARERGLHLTPRDLFEHPTIAALAPVVAPSREWSVPAAIGRAAPLGPVQRWFAEQAAERPDRFVQVLALDVAFEIEADRLEHAWRSLVGVHPILAARFDLDPVSGSQSLPEEAAGTALVCSLDHRGWLSADAEAALHTALCGLRDRLDIRNGRLFALCHQRREQGLPGRLVVIAHHLVMDAVSLRIVTADLLDLLHGEGVAPPPETTSYLVWSQWLSDHAARLAGAEARDWWRRQIAGASTKPETVAAIEEAQVESDAALTRRLREMTRTGTSIQEVLLTAYACALGDWSGAPSMTIDLEGHGRQTPSADQDFSRTVGWFTTVYPLHIGVMPHRLGMLDAVARALRSVTDGGLSYAVLRHLSADRAEQLAWRSPAWARFNYLGVADVHQRHGGVALSADTFTWLRDAGIGSGYASELSVRITDDHLLLNVRHAGDAAAFAARVEGAIEALVSASERARRDDEAELRDAMRALDDEPPVRRAR